MQKIKRYLPALMIPILASCASNHAESYTGPNGYLKVYSSTQTRIVGEDAYYYPHTGYTIEDAKGNFVKYVPNHVGTMDNMPTIVPVPVGQYLLRAQSDWTGRTTFPVEVKPGKTLVIHLERDGKQPAKTDGPRVIHQSDGRFVGWRE
jgi:hypothetical protein